MATLAKKIGIGLGATLIALALTVGGILLSAAYYTNGWTNNNPTRIYQGYADRLSDYVKRLQAGRVEVSAAGDYAIPQFLIDHGARYVRKDGDCFVIIFSFMPTDAVPELWYSPTGFNPLPDSLTERKRGATTYFKLVPLSKNWAECDWDN